MAESMSLEQFFADFPKSKRGIPNAWASGEGDCAYFYLTKAPHYRERVDNLLTVYRSHKSNRIVGVQIKGVSGLPKHFAMGVAVQDGDEVEVVTLLLLTYGIATAVAAESDPTTQFQRARVYQDAMKEFEDERVKLDDLVGAR